MAPRGRSYQLYAAPVTILAHLIAITVTVLVLVWLLKFEGGFAFKSGNKLKIFNLHPFLMVVGLIIFGGEGTYAVFKFKDETGTKDLVSLHTWLGIIAISAYGLQFVLGFFTFFFPGAAMPTRGSLLPWHTYFGTVIFLLAVCAAETGLIQRFIGLGLALKLNQEGLIVNFTGLLIFLFGVSVTLSVILPRGSY
ncbi:Cytochrome b561 and DOMON domain-containing protein [Parasponia andersonii]|uniref:Cytochrome b561 and DOMON domain-containing protein n=1 Tax=Parasponia andersonii TaxID=3476 RepID=A0A2P5CIG4_PARAD|nr:Cytochrome b561 and DOMON domain-containing protein [Parasponia andersonii]